MTTTIEPSWTAKTPPPPHFNFPPIIFIGLDVPHSLERGLCVRKARFYKNNNVNYICSASNCLLLMMFLRKRKKSINHYKNCRCLHVCLVFGMMYMYTPGIWLSYSENTDLYRLYNRVLLTSFISFLIVLRMSERGNVATRSRACSETYQFGPWNMLSVKSHILTSEGPARQR